MGQKVLPEISNNTSLSVSNQSMSTVFLWLSLLIKSPKNAKKDKNTEQTLKEKHVLVLFECSKIYETEQYLCLMDL